MSRLSDDEKRVFSDQISLLKNENERLTDRIEELDVEMLTTDEEGNSVGCGMDLLDWQAHLQTELGMCRLENAAFKRALHELAQFDYRLGIDAMRKFAFDALPADTQESE